MKILPSLLAGWAAAQLQVRTSPAGYDVIKTWSDAPGELMALVEADCPMERPKPKQKEVDVVISIDTSFCNHYRIDQVRATARDILQTLTNTASGGQELGQGVRISLSTFNTDSEVLFPFSNYDRSFSGDQMLEAEINRLAFSDETTDYDRSFEQLFDLYSSTFRGDAEKYFIIYSNGNQMQEANYPAISRQC